MNSSFIKPVVGSMDIASRSFLEGQGNFLGQRTMGGSCLCYYAYG